MTGLRFMGAGPDQEGKWLTYQFGPYAAKAEALNSERIHRSYLDCIAFKAIKQPPSNRDKYYEKHQAWCTSERDRHPSAKD
jgi:hypothetical protein